MTVLKWGPLTLSVDPEKVYTFGDFEWSLGYRSEEREIEKKKPRLAAKAPEREQLSFNVLLSAALGVDVSGEVQKWKDATNAGLSYELFIGGQHFGDAASKWRIKSLGVSDVEWSAHMQMARAVLSVSMDEYPPPEPGGAKASGGGNRASSGGNKASSGGNKTSSSSSSSSSSSGKKKPPAPSPPKKKPPKPVSSVPPSSAPKPKPENGNKKPFTELYKQNHNSQQYKPNHTPQK